MKRFLTFIVSVCTLFIATAQRPLATLSHDGNMTFFSSLSAFEDAVSAAADGDIIYLSEGQFTAKSDTVRINKRLSIQGCGYKSHILPHLKIDMRNVTADELELPLFDGVRMRTLTFPADSLNRNKTKNVEIRKCYIERIERGGYAAKNLLIDRCYMDYATFPMSGLCNITLQNSKVCEFGPGNHVEGLTVINCNIRNTSYLPKTAISSIFSTPYGSFSSKDKIVLYNCLLSRQLPTDVKSYGCYINKDFSWNDKCEVDESTLLSNNWLGQDGKVVGVYGGEFPFSENPSVPTVDSENSSVEYDADTNMLNVTITVLPN